MRNNSTMWPSLTYQLAAISEDAIAMADRVFKERFGLQIHDFRVLRLIDDRSCTTLAQLAAQTKIDPGESAIIVSRLLREGYVERDTSRLRTTAKAKALRQLADPLTVEMEDLLISVLDPNQRKELENILAVLANWIRSGLQAEVLKRYPEARQAAPARSESVENGPKRDAGDGTER
jgi:DNA-binding MarR family transcriptional regulator